MDKDINIGKYSKETPVSIYGRNGNGEIIIDTLPDVFQAMEFCEQWGWGLEI